MSGTSVTGTESSNSLRQEGFYLIDDVFSERQLAPIRELTAEIVDFHKSGDRDPFSTPDCEYLDHRTDQGALYDVYQRHPEFQPLATDQLILDAVQSILGPNILLYVNSVVYKAESGDNEVPFHQDFMAREGESDKIIAWIPMYDVDETNGCLKAIPGSHREGSLSWHTVDGETHHDRLDPDQFDEEEAVYLEMNAGDVLLFHQNVVHGSDPITQSDDPRYAYRVVYKAPEVGANHVPRVGPIMLRGNDPESLREANLAASAEAYDDESSTLRRFLQGVGRRLLEI